MALLQFLTFPFKPKFESPRAVVDVIKVSRTWVTTYATSCKVTYKRNYASRWCCCCNLRPKVFYNIDFTGVSGSMVIDPIPLIPRRKKNHLDRAEIKPRLRCKRPLYPFCFCLSGSFSTFIRSSQLHQSTNTSKLNKSANSHMDDEKDTEELK